MRSITVLAAAAIMLSACGQGGTETADEEGNISSVDPETGTQMSRITTDNGTASVESGADVSADLPEGFSLYPGAEIVRVTNVSREGQKGAMVTLRTQDSAAKLAQFYRQQASAAGITIELDMTVNDGVMIGGTGPDGLSFSLSTIPNEVEPGEDAAAGEGDAVRPTDNSGVVTAQLVASKGLMN